MQLVTGSKAWSARPDESLLPSSSSGVCPHLPSMFMCRVSDLPCSCYLQVALVQWTESVGLTLVGRDQSSMQLRTPGDQILNLTILQVFPFTYESKRMGIIVRVSLALSRPSAPSFTCASGALMSFWGLITDTQAGRGVWFPAQEANELFRWPQRLSQQPVLRLAVKH